MITPTSWTYNYLTDAFLFSFLKVYESNSDRTEMAGCIQGPCEVLPSLKFQQENNRRSELEPEESARLLPIFLCRSDSNFP